MRNDHVTFSCDVCDRTTDADVVFPEGEPRNPQFRLPNGWLKVGVDWSAATQPGPKQWKLRGHACTPECATQLVASFMSESRR